MSRGGWFILGIFFGVVILVPLGAYLFVRLGALNMATTAQPLPFEQKFASTALHASMGGAAEVKDPLPSHEANLLAGVRVYRDNCAFCHGLPGQPKTTVAQGEFPPPPQLFEKDEMVTDDPEGVTYWKVTHGIRLSGMPGFGATLSDTQRWQATMLLAHANQLPSAVESALMKSLPRDAAPVVTALSPK
jgi:thiosulfate dehydrogenase